MLASLAGPDAIRESVYKCNRERDAARSDRGAMPRTMHHIVTAEGAMMNTSETRRRFLQNLTALGVAGGVTAAYPPHQAQAQNGGQLPQRAVNRDLPRIQLMIGPGTLPSVGASRMDLLRYR